jgi:hypothetical protein
MDVRRRRRRDWGPIKRGGEEEAAVRRRRRRFFFFVFTGRERASSFCSVGPSVQGRHAVNGEMARRRPEHHLGSFLGRASGQTRAHPRLGLEKDDQKGKKGLQKERRRRRCREKQGMRRDGGFHNAWSIEVRIAFLFQRSFQRRFSFSENEGGGGGEGGAKQRRKVRARPEAPTHVANVRAPIPAGPKFFRTARPMKS